MKGSDTARGSMMMALFVLGHATGFLCGRRLNGFFFNAQVGKALSQIWKKREMVDDW